ncbi:glycogen debranching N-terminal domain-containing protein [Agrococcus sediminis]|uniref:glycogen debranching N-terminal domain-containing protein n=1 Tax=Agrococcus sediminis TaxID=2599924 RepID=UPI0038073468
MCHEQSRGVGRPPLLHTELVALAAPTQVWSHRDGTMGGSAAHGVYHGDWRYVRGVELLVDGAPVEHITTADEADWVVFHAVARDLDARAPAARVMVERMREVAPGAVVERVTIVNGRDVPVNAAVELVCDVELAPMWTVRAGDPRPVGLRIRIDDGVAIATDGTRVLRCTSRGGELRVEGSRVIASRHSVVLPDDWAGFALELELDDPTLAVTGTPCPAPCAGVRPTGRAALDRWAERAVTDLEDLLLDAGHGAFPAAGAPWHVTMVARDALIASRLLLPLGTDLAEGTLRTLAARQGVRTDPATGEEPGRILHELRQDSIELPWMGVELPPVYFGSIDATPLWIVLLHDAWRAGLPLQTVRELRPSLHAALWWLDKRTGDGFLSYPEESGTGLANKAWKDSPDAMRFADGGIATGSLAVAQVQGLAVRAAVGAADLLDALGDGGERWRGWAERLRERFRAAFWVEHGHERFPALALEASGAQVDALTSDVGQLIGTTLLSAEEEREVARLLLDPRLSSGFGLRTMATDAGGYWPMSQHCGAIWPHDTAVAIEGLLRAGLGAEAAALAEQLERAADAFQGRMPQLYAGYGLDDTAAPIPVPGACSPQAWSAAAVVPVHQALTARAASAVGPIAVERHLHALTPLAPSAPEPARDAEPARAQRVAAGGAVRREHAYLRLVEPDRSRPEL